MKSIAFDLFCLLVAALFLISVLALLVVNVAATIILLDGDDF